MSLTFSALSIWKPDWEIYYTMPGFFLLGIDLCHNKMSLSNMQRRHPTYTDLELILSRGMKLLKFLIHFQERRSLTWSNFEFELGNLSHAESKFVFGYQFEGLNANEMRVSQVQRNRKQQNPSCGKINLDSMHYNSRINDIIGQICTWIDVWLVSDAA